MEDDINSIQTIKNALEQSQKQVSSENLKLKSEIIRLEAELKDAKTEIEDMKSDEQETETITDESFNEIKTDQTPVEIEGFTTSIVSAPLWSKCDMCGTFIKKTMKLESIEKS